MDSDLLPLELADLHKVGYDLGKRGFSMEDLAKIVGTIPAKDCAIPTTSPSRPTKRRREVRGLRLVVDAPKGALTLSIKAS